MADPEQLAVLSKVFEAYCQSHDLTRDADREAAAMRVVALFNSGITTVEGLTEALDNVEIRIPLHRLAG